MTGISVITEAPLIFVGTTYLGAMFFGYCGSVAGNNAVGLVFNGTSYLLSRPMRGVEITLNGLILSPISNITGLYNRCKIFCMPDGPTNRLIDRTETQTTIILRRIGNEF